MALARPQWYGTQSGHHVTLQRTLRGGGGGLRRERGTHEQYFQSMLIDVVFCCWDGWADVCCHPCPRHPDIGDIVTSEDRGLTYWHHATIRQIIKSLSEVKFILTSQSSNPKSLPRSRFGLDVTKNQWVFYKSVTVYLYPSKEKRHKLRRHKLNICLLKLL